MKHTPSIQEVTWDDVREQVKTIAPDIFAAIERMNPDKSYRLYKTRYPYGAMIVGKDGIFNVPHDNQLFPITDIRVPKQLRNDFSYNQLAVPMSLIISGQIQLYTEEYSDIVTECLYGRGVVMALRALLDSSLSYHTRRYWRMTSGARTVSMLPSIAEQTSFERLKRNFNLACNKPDTQKDHWQLFVEIANHEDFPKDWHTEFLMFSSKWLEPRDDDAWQLFHLILLKRAWKATEYLRNIGIVNRLWARFIEGIRNKKATSRVINMVRYIIEASLGQALCYIPHDSTNESGPFETLSNTFIDIYGLKKYAPIIMIPHLFNPDDNKPVYISIQTPNTPWIKAGTQSINNLVGSTAEIEYELKQFINKIKSGAISVDDTPFSTLAEFTYSFYHADQNMRDLLSSAHIFDGDLSIDRWRTHSNNNQIAFRNLFLRSCIKISQKNTT